MRTCQRLFINTLLKIKAQRRLLSKYWDAVDKSRVVAFAGQKLKELTEERKKKAAEEAKDKSKNRFQR